MISASCIGGMRKAARTSRRTRPRPPSFQDKRSGACCRRGSSFRFCTARERCRWCARSLLITEYMLDARAPSSASYWRPRSGSRRHARLVEAGAAALSLHRAHFCRRRIPAPKMAKTSAAILRKSDFTRWRDQARKSDRRQRRAAHAEQWISTQVMDARRPRCMWRRWRQLRGGRRFCWRGPRRDHFEDWGHHGILWLGCCTSPGGQGHESAPWSARATGQFDGYSRPQ